MNITTNKHPDWSKKLKSVASKFSHQQRMQWALDNHMSLYTVNNYLKGNVASAIVAEKLYRDISGKAAA